MNQRSPIGIRAYTLPLASLSLAPLQQPRMRRNIAPRSADASPTNSARSCPASIVTATNINTNVSTSSTTNEDGLYSITQLTPGQYRLSAELQGFSKFVREGITLQTADKVTIHVQLPLGTVTEVITVAAALTAAETNRSTIAQTMDNKRVSELPLNGRQVYMLLQQTPGTLFTQKSFGNTGFSGTRAWDSNGAVSIHGSRTNNNEFLIDGAPNSATGGWQYAPLVDAIEEFKVQTASVDASYGRTSGGIVNMTMKSGTNALRGTAILVYRGNALDAGTTQNNRLGLPKRDHLYSDYGGTLGGPIVRDKTFFMGYYEGFYENIPFPRTVSVPTDAQRRGDFSQTFNAQGQLVQIFDPLTTTAGSGAAGAVHSRSVSGQRDSGGSHQSRGTRADAVLPAAEQSWRSVYRARQFRGVAKRGAVSLQLVHGARRSRLQHESPVVRQQYVELGAGISQRQRLPAAGHARRISQAPQPLHDDGG